MFFWVWMSAGGADMSGHWAFQPIRAGRVPTAEPGRQDVGPIDRFIDARLRERHLIPAGQAERQTLIRRLALDLTGLPPSPEEVEAFVKDVSPNAWERVVDRFLASPRYGERWARWWLDLARYADTNGQDENKVMANAWRYRDWVIRAFNNDLPMDQFILNQLAGDLLPTNGVPEAEVFDRWTATGFLVLGPKMLAEQDKAKLVMDIVDEQIDVVGRAFLGLTVSCARCHDHKFDPIPTTEYYAMAGVFRSTRAMENLDFVSKFNERTVTPGPERPLVAAYKSLIGEREKKIATVIREANVAFTNRTGLALPKNPREEYPPETKTLLSALEQERDSLKASQPQDNQVLAVAEDKPADLPVHIRGSHLTLAKEPVRRGFLSVASGRDTELPRGDSSGRLEMARWLIHPTQPLTARVMVNRVWQAHFGEGLVRTPDNFGIRGEPPTHPELLDWLASEFIRNGWSLRGLHRMILMSETWQRTSNGRPPDSDPDNRWLSVFPRQRMEAEMVRDSLLSVSGRLDPAVGGSLVAWKNNEYAPGDTVTKDSLRRTIYLPVVRDRMYDVMTIFDCANPSVGTSRRVPTVVSHQALFFLNSPLVKESARVLAEGLLALTQMDDRERVREAYRRVFNRLPSDTEMERAGNFLAGISAGSNGRKAAWAAYCQTLFATNEFLYRG